MKKIILFVLLVAGLCPARSQNPFRVKGGVPAIAVRAADPVSPEAGMLYLNSATGCVRYYDGSQWINMSCPNQAANQAPVASNVGQSGTAEAGQFLTGTYTYSDAENNPQGTSTYKWYRADNSSGLNEAAVSGATALYYLLTAADAGKYIRFAVTPVATTGTTPGAETKATAFAGPVTGGVVNQAPVASNVGQSGTAEVGQFLTGTYAYSDAENNPQGASTYKWYRADNGSGLNEAAVSGATALYYLLTAADAGKYIRFAVTPVATTGTTPGAETKATAFAGPVTGGAANQAPVASNVGQSGTAEVGQLLTGTYTYSDAENNPQGTSTYKWYRADNGSGLNEAAVSGATALYYLLTAADAGKYIRFAVTPVATTGTTPGTETKATAFAGPVTGGAANQAPVASNVGQSGTAEVGQALTGSYTYSDAENNPQGTSTYKWYRADDNAGTNEAAVSGATALTYTLVAADATKYIRFAVTPVATTGTTPGAETKATAFAGPVSGGSGNQAPVASNLSVSGTLQSGQVLTGSYTYSDAEDDPEGVSVYRWYRAADASGTGAAVISGANAVNYTLQTADGGKYMRFAVIPRAATGTEQGAQANSDWVGPVIVCQDDVSVGSGALVYMLYDMDGNGSAEYNWCAREVALYGKTWLDRNLGAYRVPNAINDNQGYGDYYQWGRDMDGHQNMNSATIAGPVDSAQPGHGLFVTVDFLASPNDWCTVLEPELWQGAGAVNSPCPAGYRLPSYSELNVLATNFTNRESGYASTLKTPIAGYRTSGGVASYTIGYAAFLWSSSIGSCLYLAKSGDASDVAMMYTMQTAYGMNVRCIKN